MPATNRKRFDIVYERKLAGVLSRSQADSCVALVDLASGEHLQRVKSRSPLNALDGDELLRLTRALWQPAALNEAEAEKLHQFVTAAGGVEGVTVPLEHADLFVSRLQSGTRALVLLVRHRERNNVKQDTMPRARLIQTRLSQLDGDAATSAMQTAAAGPAQREYSQSILQTLLHPLTTAFDGNGNLARSVRLSSGLLAKAIRGDGLVVFAELIDLTQDKVLQQYLAQDGNASVPDPERSILALHHFFDGDLDVAGVAAACGFTTTEYGKALLHLGDRDYFSLRVPLPPALPASITPNGVLLLYKKSRLNPSLDWIALNQAGVDLHRMHRSDAGRWMPTGGRGCRRSDRRLVELCGYDNSAHRLKPTAGTA